MNDDDFEKKLHALTGALHRPDPTPAWKADILARARREADAIPFKRTLPPRWLMLGWAAAWAAVLAMYFTAPQDTATDYAVNKVKTTPPNTTTPQSDAPTLLAFQRHLNLNLDLPQ
ncbi:MAG: hypothetical protein K8R87_06645 [Verrucomicrobia bacterium]|nr:hypothetical protein [Verrucomicrobiota bacterium]